MCSPADSLIRRSIHSLESRCKGMHLTGSEDLYAEIREILRRVIHDENKCCAQASRPLALDENLWFQLDRIDEHGVGVIARSVPYGRRGGEWVRKLQFGPVLHSWSTAFVNLDDHSGGGKQYIGRRRLQHGTRGQ